MEKSALKNDNLTPEHLKWLVNSRTSNQKSALRLFEFFDNYPTKIKRSEFAPKVQMLVAVCFSLWRAAFLADKTGLRIAVLEDAKNFLGKMLTDNAITYPQDRNSREFTFNYYMVNARDNLVNLGKDWKEILEQLSIENPVANVPGSTLSSRRWNRHQKAFETALDCFEKALTESRAVKKSKQKK
jgi:hypothetical protein